MDGQIIAVGSAVGASWSVRDLDPIFATMTDTIDRLTTALADRYAIERELGSGGMATVYLAEDLKHHRKVAVKVLRPELAAVLGSERFIREIEIAAQLEHPHILTLIDSGEADGFLFFVMPYIKGESLREKLAHGELPIADAVRILRDVTDALSHAHGEGLVHRDIKPDNVLLSGNHAVVTDFGVAKAVSEATGRERLTTAGVALGTPVYMAPEQAVADPNIDHRADIYALGVLAYEMVAGRPPFGGDNAQAILSAHVTQAPTAVTGHRPAVPPVLADLIMRCLEKKPADRWQTAEEVLQQLEAATTPSVGITPTDTRPLPATEAKRTTRVAIVGAVVAVVVIGIFMLRNLASDSVALDPDAVVIAPFRVSGAADVEGLDEALPDLLYTKLNGESGLRAVEPRSAFAMWRSAAGGSPGGLGRDGGAEVARRLGAAHLVDGLVVAAGNQLTISATLVSAADRGVEAEATVVGESGALLGLVDSLAIKLLGTQAGADDRLEGLLSTSVPAVQAYLAGKREFRRSRFTEAQGRFYDALALDSSFALAALGLRQALLLGTSEADRASSMAWNLRERLSLRDRAFLEARLGPNYPVESHAVEILDALESALGQAPQNVELLTWFASRLMVWGPFLPVAGWEARAVNALERAISIDSSYAEAARLRLQLAIRAQDAVAIDRFGKLYVDLASGSEVAPYYRWQIAMALGDSTGLAEIRNQLDTFPRFSLISFHARTVLHGWPLRDAAAAAAIITSRVSTRAEYRGSLDRRAAVAVVGGRAEEAVVLFDTLESVDYGFMRELFWQALVGPGYVDAAEGLAQRLAARVEQLDLNDRCFLGLWWAHSEQRAAAVGMVDRMRATPPVERPLRNELCATLIEAWADMRDLERFGTSSLSRLDSLTRLGVAVGGAQPLAAYLLARWHEARGEYSAALASIRRRYYWNRADLTYIMPAFYREEARLAALAGDPEGSVEALSKYLNLRSDPGPALQPEVDQMRALLEEQLGKLNAR